MLCACVHMRACVCVHVCQEGCFRAQTAQPHSKSSLPGTCACADAAPPWPACQTCHTSTSPSAPAPRPQTQPVLPPPPGPPLILVPPRSNQPMPSLQLLALLLLTSLSASAYSTYFLPHYTPATPRRITITHLHETGDWAPPLLAETAAGATGAGATCAAAGEGGACPAGGAAAEGVAPLPQGAAGCRLAASFAVQALSGLGWRGAPTGPCNPVSQPTNPCGGSGGGRAAGNCFRRSMLHGHISTPPSRRMGERPLTLVCAPVPPVRRRPSPPCTMLQFCPNSRWAS